MLWLSLIPLLSLSLPTPVSEDSAPIFGGITLAQLFRTKDMLKILYIVLSAAPILALLEFNRGRVEGGGEVP